ncbi:SCO1664 family protein [Calidifontibacter terrae]
MRTGELQIEGRLIDASNMVLRAWIEDADERIPVVYKPIRGERPLWDFPPDTLAGREVAACLVSQAAGWNLVPPTELREGPLGPGSVQRWVGPLLERPDHDLVRIDPPQEVPPTYVPVLAAETDDEDPLIVSHADTPWLRRLAVFDALLNNADRKASAILPDGDRYWAIDHGLCFHDEEKLRTVLWGYAQEPIRADDLQGLSLISAALEDGLRDDLRNLVSASEIDAFEERLEVLLNGAEMPAVPLDRHPLPWPLW